MRNRGIEFRSIHSRTPPPSFPHSPPSFPPSPHVIPAPTNVIPALPPSFPHPPTSSPHSPRHSRTHQRHPRQRHPRPTHVIPAKAGIPCIAFDKTEPTYYHRTMTTPSNHTQRRQPHMRNMQTPNRVTPRPRPSLVIRPQSQHTSRHDAKLAVSKIRQNATQYDRMPQNATKTRARTRARQRHSVSFLSVWIAPRPQQVGRTAGSRRPRTAMPTDRTKPGLDIP